MLGFTHTPASNATFHDVDCNNMPRSKINELNFAVVETRFNLSGLNLMMTVESNMLTTTSWL